MTPHLLPIGKVQQLLQTSSEGLDETSVLERHLQYGKNELIGKKKKSSLSLLLAQLKDIMILILIAAAVISFSIGDIKDALVILVIVVLNAVIGFVQEYRAEKALEALKKIATPYASVRRAGIFSQIPASALVPGDVVMLEAGMLVPADIRLSQTHSLKIEEASLTGESHPVEKRAQELFTADLSIGDRRNMAYKATVVTYGRGEGIVVATGMKTEIGRIAQLLLEEESQTPLQKRLASFGRILSMVVVVICIIIYGAGLLRGEDPVHMLLTAISVAVAAIPEALPAVITISLALGARKMVRKNALIRKLPAVETLGSVTYICSDKTGTITQNKMTVVDMWVPPSGELVPGFSSRELLLLSMELNHDVASQEGDSLHGDPTEVALVRYARNSSDFNSRWRTDFIREEELPFDSVRKRMTTIYPFGVQWLIITKGALESVLASCSRNESASISAQALNFGEQGKRVLAYAARLVDQLPAVISTHTIEADLTFVGLVAMMDPPREEVKETIADCYSAGIIPVMITGDHPATAKAIAVETGIVKKESDRIITGSELASLSDEEFERDIESIKVYARVSPEQKLHIVKMLQHKKHFVAMTGDGVNDAPALKRANIGVAMGITGTDVSREASHMVLLDDNFATIIKAVREGRRIFDNIRKFIKYTLTSNSGEIWTIFLAPLAGLPIPLLPIHILWINLVTDGLPGLALASEPAEDNIMHRKPRATDESIFAQGIALHILWVGLLMGAVCLGIQAWAIHEGNDKWQTMVFTVLCISQMGHAMSIRSDWKSLFRQGVFGNIQLVSAVMLTLALQMAVIYLPALQDVFRTKSLSIFELLLCIGLSSLVFWAVEAEKVLRRARSK